MTATAESLLHQVLALPENDRAELAERLWHSVPGWDDPADEAGFTEEQKVMFDRRWEEIESGRVKCRPAEDVLNEIEARLHERLGTAP